MNLGKKVDPVKELVSRELPSFRWIRRTCIKRGYFSKWQDFVIKRNKYHPESLGLI